MQKDLSFFYVNQLSLELKACSIFGLLILFHFTPLLIRAPEYLQVPTALHDRSIVEARLLLLQVRLRPYFCQEGTTITNNMKTIWYFFVYTTLKYDSFNLSFLVFMIIHYNNLIFIQVIWIKINVALIVQNGLCHRSMQLFKMSVLHPFHFSIHTYIYIYKGELSLSCKAP